MRIVEMTDDISARSNEKEFDRVLKTLATLTINPCSRDTPSEMEHTTTVSDSQVRASLTVEPKLE